MAESGSEAAPSTISEQDQAAALKAEAEAQKRRSRIEKAAAIRAEAAQSKRKKQDREAALMAEAKRLELEEEGFLHTKREIFRGRLKKARLAEGLNQASLAEALRVTPNSVCYWEQGKSVPSYDTLLRLAILLNTALAYLSGDAEAPGYAG